MKALPRRAATRTIVLSTARVGRGRRSGGGGGRHDVDPNFIDDDVGGPGGVEEVEAAVPTERNHDQVGNSEAGYPVQVGSKWLAALTGPHGEIAGRGRVGHGHVEHQGVHLRGVINALQSATFTSMEGAVYGAGVVYPKRGMGKIPAARRRARAVRNRGVDVDDHVNGAGCVVKANLSAFAHFN